MFLQLAEHYIFLGKSLSIRGALHSKKFPKFLFYSGKCISHLSFDKDLLLTSSSPP